MDRGVLRARPGPNDLRVEVDVKIRFTSHLVADVHAQAARAYGINGDDYTYILDSFPLVPAAEREAALRAFTSGTLR